MRCPIFFETLSVEVSEKSFFPFWQYIHYCKHKKCLRVTLSCSMIAADLHHRRGPNPSDVVLLTANPAFAGTEPAAMKLRALSPTDCLLAMNGLWMSLNPGFSTSPVLSPATTPISSLSSPSMIATTASSYPPSGTLPPLDVVRVSTGALAAASSSTNSAALLDHYSRVIRSRALAHSTLEMERRAKVVAALSGRRTATSSSVPIKARTRKSKFSMLGHRSPTATVPLSLGVWKKAPLSCPTGLQPLRAPPALPRVTPGQQLIGMKSTSKEKEVSKKA
jgi:hypothetical protein